MKHEIVLLRTWAYLETSLRRTIHKYVAYEAQVFFTIWASAETPNPQPEVLEGQPSKSALSDTLCHARLKILIHFELKLCAHDQSMQRWTGGWWAAAFLPSPTSGDRQQLFLSNLINLGHQLTLLWFCWFVFHVVDLCLNFPLSFVGVAVAGDLS
jgi:hypothetical protein